MLLEVFESVRLATGPFGHVRLRSSLGRRASLTDLDCVRDRNWATTSSCFFEDGWATTGGLSDVEAEAEALPVVVASGGGGGGGLGRGGRSWVEAEQQLVKRRKRRTIRE